MCGESRTHGFEAEGKKATSGSTVTLIVSPPLPFSPSPLLPLSPAPTTVAESPEIVM
ncbi:hypothetical protein CKA32_005500 [Geitlerinema sp. FC II]|nr:hypothetical protein CKA32_005500 [Geitlerinema sp. FC II]